MSTLIDPPAIKYPHRSPEFTVQDKEIRTILCPQMAPIHFALMQAVFENHGCRFEILPEVDREAIEEGLRYVNNDVCYPAIVVVGQLIQAMKSGNYDPDRTALMISQTCGGCRSTNYAAFLKIAAAKAGFHHVPVIPFSVDIANGNTKGMNVNFKMLKKMFLAFLYGDLLLMLSNRCRPYEIVQGSANMLVERWITRLRREILSNKKHSVADFADQIVHDFDVMELDEEQTRPRVGIVGEILVKYHPGANNHLITLIEQEGGEVVVPNTLDFMLYCLKSDEQRKRYSHVPFFSGLKSSVGAWLIERQRNTIRNILKKSRRFVPMGTIRHLIRLAEKIVSTCNHTGEGWLLTAEMVELIEENVPNIVCVQPFGCLPNHVTGKGVLKELRSRYTQANITTIDYDPGSTEVNQLNRIKLLMAVALRNLPK
ncbi:MAG: 2-hydroxyacyl-CoA dehydratase [Planctomycetaceae bacterium]|jgi:predicted nucleotide-binding protein (sugar kinase/HSP70/actin superfamily)|nr:2-hydroxyacyl-CoA dehydratase [Planctomycetaceae bacterium]